MRRREFVLGVGGLVACPIVAQAQQKAGVRMVGVLMGYAENDSEGQARSTAFLDGLQKLGWTQGRNIRIDIRWAAPDAPEVRQQLAKELVALQPDLIFSNNTLTTQELLKQTHSIPILFGGVSDPISSGFVESFRRPGGNVTGFINTESQLAGKWVQLLKEIAPGVGRVALLFNLNTANYAEGYLAAFKAAASSLGTEATVASIRDEAEIESVIVAQAARPNTGLVVMPESFFVAHRAEVISLAARYRLPCVYPFRAFAEQGGLLSYGNDQIDNFRRAASYADRILKGEKPGELPVQAPVKFELIVNLKTASTLGLDVPVSLQQRADRLVE
jgi:putative tryptophan/tyrosine transport system substrate-binding protein